MKRQAIMILTILSLFVMLTATSVYAQSDMRLKVNIPFEFSVRNRVLPAGEYIVRYRIRHLLEIRTVDGRGVQFFTFFTQARTTPIQSALVFHRYGDQYFLSKIWTEGEDTGREIFESRAERELIRARSALVKSALAPQIVSISAYRQ